MAGHAWRKDGGLDTDTKVALADWAVSVWTRAWEASEKVIDQTLTNCEPAIVSRICTDNPAPDFAIRNQLGLLADPTAGRPLDGVQRLSDLSIIADGSAHDLATLGFPAPDGYRSVSITAETGDKYRVRAVADIPATDAQLAWFHRNPQHAEQVFEQVYGSRVDLAEGGAHLEAAYEFDVEPQTPTADLALHLYATDQPVMLGNDALTGKTWIVMANHPNTTPVDPVPDLPDSNQVQEEPQRVNMDAPDDGPTEHDPHRDVYYDFDYTASRDGYQPDIGSSLDY